jgi:hypothetical protein
LTAAAAGADELTRLPLDDAAALGTAVTNDARISADGGGSVKITSGWPTVINLAEVPVNIEAATLVYRAQLRTENLTGSAYLEMWCHFPDGGQYFSRGLNSTISGDAEWRTLETRFFLQAGQNPTKVTLNLVINGAGTVWVDDVRLSKEPLP